MFVEISMNLFSPVFLHFKLRAEQQLLWIVAAWKLSFASWTCCKARVASCKQMTQLGGWSFDVLLHHTVRGLSPISKTAWFTLINTDIHRNTVSQFSHKSKLALLTAII